MRKLGVIALLALLLCPPVYAAQDEESLDYFRAYPIANRGYQLIKQERYEEAIPLFERAVEILPDNVGYRIQLAYLLLDVKRAADAERVVTSGLVRSPQETRLHEAYENVTGKRFIATNPTLVAEKPAAPVVELPVATPKALVPPAASAPKRTKPRFVAIVEQPGAEAYYAGLKAQKDGKPEEAVAAFKRALAEEPDNRLYHISLAYAHRNLKQNEPAIPHFAAGLKSRYDAKIGEDFAYTLKDEGYREQAAQQFRKMLDTEKDMKKFHAVRRDIQQLEDEWVSYGSLTYRDGLARASGIPGIQSFNESMQYGFETIYGPERWQRNERRVQLFAQAFASSNSGQFDLNDNTAQGAVGIRGTPLPATEWYLYAARLFPIGSQAISDWQLRSTYAYTMGYDIDPTETAWPYVFVTPDVSYLTNRSELFATLESRFGYSYRPSHSWVLTPHLVAAGAHQHNRNTSSDSVEVGPGISIKYWFDEEAKRAARASGELIFQWREAMGSTEDKSGPFVRFVMQY
ncbi:MAG: tetratricopeptide repeat protein [Alphaproteobacteria bacterium]|nr:tetratricopeptide repeat protein [Alphaproteobacteria bacterium]